MKKLAKKIISGLLVSSFALTTVGFAPMKEESKGIGPMHKISKVIAFGDSCTDNGGAYEASKAILELPNPPTGAYLKPGEEYWQNRYSNGKTAVEVLAEMMDKKIINYAVGGATSGYENYSSWMDILGYTGVLGQIEKFEADLKGREADDEALYFIFAGANDAGTFEGTTEEIADQVVVNIGTAVRKLAELGAEKFFIVNSLDGSLVPYSVSTGDKDGIEYSNRINTRLPEVLNGLEKELKIDIIQYDITGIMRNMVDNPDRYGLKYVDVECLTTVPEMGQPKPYEDLYLFWDEWHLSRVGHRFIGEDMYKAISKK